VRPGATSATPAPAKSGDRASHGALYNAKRGLTIHHRDRKHIGLNAEGGAKAEIDAIDNKIKIQVKYGHPDGKASAIAMALEKLLDLPCFQPSEHNSAKRGAEQKTALETFTTAFPLAISKDNKHLTVLKKLIDTLPNLGHHETIEQSPQLRGIKVLKEALGSLPPNDVAEILVHQMDGIRNLRNERSRHKVISKGSAASLLRTAVKSLAATNNIHVRSMLDRMEARGKKSRAIKRQPQGKALYELKDQLKKLRKDWSAVTPDNQQKLITAFDNLQTDGEAFFGTESSNLRSYWRKVDPSRF